MNISKVWLLPLAAMAAFLGLLVGGIPYATGYGWLKIPLGFLIWQMWHIPDWQYAPLVPLICLVLVFSQREKIRQAPIRGSNWAIAWILLGILVYCIGLKAEMQYFGFLAIQILLAGLILWFWGIRVFRHLTFAWLFLLFAWPLPFLQGALGLPLRLVMSHASTTMLNLLGTPCVQSGTAVLSAANLPAGLKLGDKFQVDIADPCSGLHSLFALMMISALAGYISMNKSSLRLLVFLAAIPIAILGNVVRILLLVWGTQSFGSSFALGTEGAPSWFHTGCGYAVYLVALAFLFGFISFLNSKWSQRQFSRLSHLFMNLRHPSPEAASESVAMRPID
jgi:exosortase